MFYHVDGSMSVCNHIRYIASGHPGTAEASVSIVIETPPHIEKMGEKMRKSMEINGIFWIGCINGEGDRVLQIESEKILKQVAIGYVILSDSCIVLRVGALNAN